jgi:hypothetical protein
MRIGSVIEDVKQHLDVFGGVTRSPRTDTLQFIVPMPPRYGRTPGDARSPRFTCPSLAQTAIDMSLAGDDDEAVTYISEEEHHQHGEAADRLFAEIKGAMTKLQRRQAEVSDWRDDPRSRLAVEFANWAETKEGGTLVILRANIG